RRRASTTVAGTRCDRALNPRHPPSVMTTGRLHGTCGGRLRRRCGVARTSEPAAPATQGRACAASAVVEEPREARPLRDRTLEPRVRREPRERGAEPFLARDLRAAVDEVAEHRVVRRRPRRLGLRPEAQYVERTLQVDVGA